MHKRVSIQAVKSYGARHYLLASTVLLVVVVATLVLAGCGTTRTDTKANGLAPYIQADPRAIDSVAFPSYVTENVRDAYMFALEHPEVLRYMPCYCGCGLMAAAHESNLDCFIAGVEQSSRVVVFDSHASGCDICVEIARDSRDLLAQGKSLTEIRDYIDLVHGKKGPGTDTERP